MISANQIVMQGYMHNAKDNIQNKHIAVCSSSFNRLSDKLTTFTQKEI